MATAGTFSSTTEIRHVCLELRDNGAINAWMDDPQSEIRAGHIIRFNLMSDIPGCRTKAEGSILTPDGMANGIYLDNDTSNCLIQGNIIVRASGYGVFVHGGQHNAIENNIIIDATTTASDRSVIGCGQVGYAGYLREALSSWVTGFATTSCPIKRANTTGLWRSLCFIRGATTVKPKGKCLA